MYFHLYLCEYATTFTSLYNKIGKQINVNDDRYNHVSSSLEEHKRSVLIVWVRVNDTIKVTLRVIEIRVDHAYSTVHSCSWCCWLAHYNRIGMIISYHEIGIALHSLQEKLRLPPRIIEQHLPIYDTVNPASNLALLNLRKTWKLVLWSCAHRVLYCYYIPSRCPSII